MSFGPLNVLVGPNGAGKTNILKVFQFLGDVARLDLIPAIDEFGGFDNLYFRGGDQRRSPENRPISHRRVDIDLKGIITKYASHSAPDEYKLRIWQRDILGRALDDKSYSNRRVVQRVENISFKRRTTGRGRRITLSGSSVKVEDLGGTRNSKLPPKLSVQTTSSGLATLRKLGAQYNAEQVEELAQVFEQLRLFEIDVEQIGRPTQTTEPNRLRPDASNLVPFLRWVRESYPYVYEQICDDVRFVLPGFDSFVFTEIGGADSAIRLDIRERISEKPRLWLERLLARLDPSRCLPCYMTLTRLSLLALKRLIMDYTPMLSIDLWIDFGTLLLRHKSYWLRTRRHW